MGGMSSRDGGAKEEAPPEASEDTNEEPEGFQTPGVGLPELEVKMPELEVKMPDLPEVKLPSFFGADEDKPKEGTEESTEENDAAVSALKDRMASFGFGFDNLDEDLDALEDEES